MRIFYNNILPPKGFSALTAYPFILARKDCKPLTKKTVNHEGIHARQQLEMLWLPFFIWYFLEYLVRLIMYRNRDKAYRSICFEAEAYANEKDLEYLAKRRLWGFLKYV
jgi:hypothetical protein